VPSELDRGKNVNHGIQISRQFAGASVRIELIENAEEAGKAVESWLDFEEEIFSNNSNGSVTFDVSD
jgi:hypothetical protein